MPLVLLCARRSFRNRDRRQTLLRGSFRSSFFSSWNFTREISSLQSLRVIYNFHSLRFAKNFVMQEKYSNFSLVENL